MKKIIILAANDWKYRLISYFLILLIFILILTELSFITSYLAATFGENYKIITTLIDFCLLISPIIIIEKFRNVNWIKYYGLNIDSYFSGYLIRGFLYTAAPFIILFIIYRILGTSEINNSFEFSKGVTVSVILLLIFAAQEEIVFRGFIQSNLTQKFSNTTSIIIASLFFSFMHSMNSNYTLVASINTFLAGVLFGTMFSVTKSLWLPIFYHYFWNVFQYLLLGSNISGHEQEGKFLITHFDSETLRIIFGNEYGFESSVTAGLILITMIFLIKKVETLNPKNSSYIFSVNNKLDRKEVENDI